MTAPTKMATKSLEQLESRITALEELCAEMYQVAGAIGAPLRILDQLASAAAGKRLPLESVLPFDGSECQPLPSVAAAALGRKGGSAKSARKAKASRANGRLHGGRPAKFAPGDLVVAKKSAPVATKDRSGVIVRRGGERASFVVRFEGEKKTTQLRSWHIRKADA